MAQIDVQEVMKNCAVKTDVSGKWVSREEVEKLVVAVVSKCAEVAGKNSYLPGHAIKKEFKMD